ncbi:unnamed protein product [Linum trigynum]|uniref:Uncharacterized protein n=1 Tax=Linum trigynum TaxID=586398 RepID=A0AAV2CCB9_9ROSI
MLSFAVFEVSILGRSTFPATNGTLCRAAYSLSHRSVAACRSPFPMPLFWTLTGPRSSPSFRPYLAYSSWALSPILLNYGSNNFPLIGKSYGFWRLLILPMVDERSFSHPLPTPCPWPPKKRRFSTYRLIILHNGNHPMFTCPCCCSYQLQ